MKENKELQIKIYVKSQIIFFKKINKKTFKKRNKGKNLLISYVNKN